jgi:hypothetical protein
VAIPNQNQPQAIPVRPYRCVLWSVNQKDPFLFDIEVPNAISAVLAVAHVAHLLYPNVTGYEIYDKAELILIAKVPIGLAVASVTKKIAEWLKIPMPLNAATIIRPKGDEAFDLAEFFNRLKGTHQGGK